MSCSLSPTTPWMLLENANVVTFDASCPKARSILIEGNRIRGVFASDTPDLSGMRSPVHRVNLEGRTVLPAFTDSHIHFLEWGFSLGRANLEPARSAEEVATLLSEFHKNEPVPSGKWVIGLGWSHNQWREPNLPLSTRLLDDLFPDNPVLLYSLCGHLAWVNAAALRMAGITSTTQCVSGGEITRHPQTGEMTGILKENAIQMVDKTIGKPSEADRRNALKRAIQEAHRHGIVAIHDVESVETFELFQEANLEGWLDVRVAFYLPVAVLDDLIRGGIRSGLGDERLKVGGVKLFTDGSLGGRTAWMLEPYLEEPKHTGIPILGGKELRDIIGKANANGLSCATHAIGDRAVRETLNAYQASWRAMDGDRKRGFLRNRIEHFQTVHPDDFAILGEVPVAACMQPHHLFADWRAADRYFGIERARRTYPCRTLRDSGAILSFGSDAPVATVHVPSGLYASVYRRDLEGNPDGGWYPEECIRMEEALEAYCSAPAAITNDQDHRGCIRTGLVADLVVFDSDPLTSSMEAIRDANPSATLFDGKWV